MKTWLKWGLWGYIIIFIITAIVWSIRFTRTNTVGNLLYTCPTPVHALDCGLLSFIIYTIIVSLIIGLVGFVIGIITGKIKERIK